MCCISIDSQLIKHPQSQLTHREKHYIDEWLKLFLTVNQASEQKDDPIQFARRLAHRGHVGRDGCGGEEGWQPSTNRGGAVNLSR